jgi:hypothetical protein
VAAIIIELSAWSAARRFELFSLNLSGGELPNIEISKLFIGVI